MYEVLSHIISTPYFWSALGSVTAITMFIGPVLYNGNLTLVTKSVVGVGIYAFFLGLLLQSHVLYVEHQTFPFALQPILFTTFMTTAYVLGLYLGVIIHKYIGWKNKHIN